MYRITESIQINRPPEKVFAFLRDLEARIKLNPSCTVVSFEALTHKEMCAGARFRFFLMINGQRTKYECEVIEFVENKRIVSRALDDRLRITLTLAENTSGTLLKHDEEYYLPDDTIFQSADSGPLTLFLKIWPRLHVVFASFDFYNREKSKKAEEIRLTLSNVLRTWLGKIKEKLESEPLS